MRPWTMRCSGIFSSSSMCNPHRFGVMRKGMFEFGILRGGSEFDSGRPQKKLKSWWGGETGIWPILVVDSKYGSAVKKTHEKTLHCGKQPRKQRMRGARPGVPKWRALPLKKSTNHRPERGSNPGHEGPWSYYLPITPHYKKKKKSTKSIIGGEDQRRFP